MKITNKNNLPEALVKAVEGHNHKGGDYSASMLENPARIYWLKKRHYDKLTEDVSVRLWALFGTAVHSIIEKNAGDNEIAEGYHRENFIINGRSVSLS